MPSYAAFLGHQPQISIAELSATIADFELTTVIGKKIAIFQSEEKLDQKFFARLGGTVVMAKQVSDAPLSLEDIPKVLKNEVKSGRKKVTFGLRTLGLPKQTVRDLYRKSKDIFRKGGRPCRYVGNDRKPAPPVLLHDADMLEGSYGCELTILSWEDENENRNLWIGRTCAAQDIVSYAKRDMQKPVRDTTTGLLPPKLAQILLNFGDWVARQGEQKQKETVKKKRKLTVLDPFCGTGVIPMEALLRGWTVYASDKSQKAVNGCTKNIDWLRKEEKILKKDVPSTVWKQDALKPFDFKETPDVIVTETSLGPPLTKRPPAKDAKKFKTENEKLQADFLKNASETLPGVPLVCIWPIWRQKTEAIRLEKIWKVIEELGYEAVLPHGITPENTERPTLVYRRPDQLVWREIVLLKPTK